MPRRGITAYGHVWRVWGTRLELPLALQQQRTRKQGDPNRPVKATGVGV